MCRHAGVLFVWILAARGESLKLGIDRIDRSYYHAAHGDG
jgi:hypothetical protein